MSEKYSSITIREEEEDDNNDEKKNRFRGEKIEDREWHKDVFETDEKQQIRAFGFPSMRSNSLSSSIIYPQSSDISYSEAEEPLQSPVAEINICSGGRNISRISKILAVERSRRSSQVSKDSKVREIISKNESDVNVRCINVLHPESHELPYCTNIIKTSKYSVNPFSRDFFLWKNLFEQLKRKANVYFLIIGLMQLVPGLSPTGTFTTLSTFIIVIMFSMCKSLYEDYQRYSMDCVENGKLAYVLRLSPNPKDKVDNSVYPRFVEVKYTDVRVGDIIRVFNTDIIDCDTKNVSRNNQLPCDTMLLACSDPTGIAGVETSNLDGEINIKMRQVINKLNIVSDCKYSMSPQTSVIFQNSFNGVKLDASLHHTCAIECVRKYNGSKIECEVPNGNFYVFNGNFISPCGEKFKITPEQMMYRGSSLRKVTWIVGVCINTGLDTKMMMNSRKPPHKSSHMERHINHFLVSVAVLLGIMCITGVIVNAVITDDLWYIGTNKSYLLFFSLLILFNNIIPISLYVTLEIIKLIQGRMMGWDLAMYYKQKDMPAVAKATDLNEELGQITHIFCDKTGTLTCNIMTFMKFFCNGTIYGSGVTEVGRAAAMRRGETVVDDRPLSVIESDFPFYDSRINNNKWMMLDDRERIYDMFLLLSICHTTDEGRCEPDEEALVKAANAFGIRFINDNSGNIILEIGATGIEEKVMIHEIIPFDSDRKCMSVLIQFIKTGAFKVMSKGADNVMLSRLSNNNEANEIEFAKAALDQFCEEGLRTLVLCARDISMNEALSWSYKYRSAKEIIGEDVKRDEVMNRLAAQLEQDFTLIGVTGIEDKLQDGVAQSIEAFQRAGIKVWMLSGDKLETVINVGYACSLLYSDSVITVISHLENKSEIMGHLSNVAATANSPPRSLVVDGDSLMIILDDEELRDEFYKFSQNCHTVVCSRVSPKQKAMIVNLVREKESTAITLAIGDGANDVSMIQSAHVGVGISGMEGQQAANSADYSIGQFRFLHRLILIHGRANYARLAMTINYFFYKNAILVMTQFWFCMFNRFSGQSLYEMWTLSMYNVAFSAFPVILFGTMDRDILNTDSIHAIPELYSCGLKNKLFNIKTFLLWLFNGIFHSLIIFFVVAFCWNGIDDTGGNGGLDAQGLVMFSCVVLVVNGKLLLHSNSLTFIHHVFLWGTIISFFLFCAIYGALPASVNRTMYHNFVNILSHVTPWLFMFIVVAFCFIIDFFVMYSVYNLLPLTLHRMVQLKDSKDPMAAVRLPIELTKESQHITTNKVTGKDALFHNCETDEEINFNQNALLQFFNPDLEDQFVAEYVGSLKRYKIALFLSAVVSVVLFISSVVLARNGSVRLIVEAVMWGLFMLAAWVAFLILLLSKITMKTGIHAMLLLTMLVAFSCLAVGNLLASQRDHSTHPVTLGVILLGLLTVLRPPLVHGIQYIGIAMITYFGFSFVLKVGAWNNTDIPIRIFEVHIVAVTSVITLAVSENFDRKMFVSQKMANIANKRSIREENRSLLLLGNVLPAAIVHEIRQNKRQLEQFSVGYDKASTLHSDIVKFTNFSSSNEPHIVVEVLNKLYTQFDAKAKELNLEKIKTIGDAYICAAGVPIADDFHQEKILLMSLLMLKCVRNLNVEGTTTLKNPDIKIRLGVATGSCFTGVVGMQKVCYEVFGDCPELSERMEQTGLPLRVHCTHSLVNDSTSLYFDFEEIEGEWYVVGEKECTNLQIMLESTQVEERSVPVADKINNKIFYSFLEEKASFDIWSNFKGQMKLVRLTFTFEFAEINYQKYIRSLSSKRFVTELTQGAYLFCAATILLSLNLRTMENNLIIVLFATSVIHIIIVVVVKVVKWLLKAAAEKALKVRRMTIAEGNSPLFLDNQTIKCFDRKNSNLPSQEAGIISPLEFEVTNINFDTTDYTDNSRIKFKDLVPQLFILFSAVLALSTSATVFFIVPSSDVFNVFFVLGVQCYVMTFLQMQIAAKFIISIVHFLVVSAGFFYSIHDTGFSVFKDGGNYSALFFCYVLTIMSAYIMEKALRRSFTAAKNVIYRNAETNNAVALCDKILNNVLPAQIIFRMKEIPGKQIVDDVPSATVFFLYIHGFKPTEGKSVVDTISDINAFLCVIDSITVKYRVEKIKTVPYLVVSGCPDRCDDHAEHSVLCAQAIILATRQFNKEYDCNIQVKIGIHTGRVTAGVLGSSKFLYDIFGDTVNVSSRMASTAEWNTIQMSRETKECIAPLVGYNYHSIGRKEMKGKGELEIFVLDVQNTNPV